MRWRDTLMMHTDLCSSMSGFLNTFLLTEPESWASGTVYLYSLAKPSGWCVMESRGETVTSRFCCRSMTTSFKIVTLQTTENPALLNSMSHGSLHLSRKWWFSFKTWCRVLECWVAAACIMFYKKVVFLRQIWTFTMQFTRQLVVHITGCVLCMFSKFARVLSVCVSFCGLSSQGADEENSFLLETRLMSTEYSRGWWDITVTFF